MLTALVLALACAGLRGALAYTVEDCVVTVTSADTGYDGSSITSALFITSKAKLNALTSQVNANCAVADGSGGWRLVGGSLWVYNAGATVTNVEALRNLVAIEGKDERDNSLVISDNWGVVLIAGTPSVAGLASIRGLRNLRGTLPGAVTITSNLALTSLSGLEGLEGIESGAWNTGYMLNINLNSALCLSVADRALITACATSGLREFAEPGDLYGCPGQISEQADVFVGKPGSECHDGGCDGAQVAFAFNTLRGNVWVQEAQVPEDPKEPDIWGPRDNQVPVECVACSDCSFSVGGGNAAACRTDVTCSPTYAPTYAPTKEPTAYPTTSPSVETAAPTTAAPTAVTEHPTLQPTQPTIAPTHAPTSALSAKGLPNMARRNVSRIFENAPVLGLH